ncbi:MAG: ABC transporter ATP-binding protein [Oceanicaulis sp.]
MSAAALKAASVRAGEAMILDGVDLAARAGEFTALVGPNGAGKSTALKALLGLVPLVSGAAELGGEGLRDLPPRRRGRLAAYLPQERPLVWRLAVEDVVALGLFAWNGRSYRRLDAAGQAKVRGELARLDVASLFGRDLTTLSGGERARVHLARALISPAPALIVDEPANALDLKHQHQAMAVLREEADAGRAVLAALHDLDAARRWADRIVVLDAGRVVADGPPDTALSPDRLAAVFGVRREEDGGYAPI